MLHHRPRPQSSLHAGVFSPLPSYQLCWILDGHQTAERPTSTVAPQLWELTFKIPSPLARLQQPDMSNISCPSHVSICITTPGPYGGGLSDICSEHDPVWPYGGLRGTRNRTFFSSPYRKGEFLQPHRICSLTRPAATWDSSQSQWSSTFTSATKGNFLL